MRKLKACLRNETAGVMVENVIILPLIFIIIYAFILTAFIVHDRTTLEAAARRGVIYAGHCISNPNYAAILKQSGSTAGVLDTSVTDGKYSFSGLGHNVKAYRYITGNYGVEENTVAEVQAIINKTQIPWRKIKAGAITCDTKNYFLYQTVTVTIEASYPLPALLGSFGLDTSFSYKVEATAVVNDPDEFIRNADLVVDLIAEVDDRFLGGSLSKVADKITSLGQKLLDWLDVGK